MCGMRRVVISAGLLVLALLPVVAAVSPEQPPQAPMPVAIAQPLAVMPSPLGTPAAPLLPESGLLVLVGTGLMGLAAVVRRTTRAL